MAKYKFVATHGVQFGEDSGDGYKVWASFTRDSSLDTPQGEKRYVFETDSADVAKRVRAVKDYGITEDKPSSSSSSGGDE